MQSNSSRDPQQDAALDAVLDAIRNAPLPADMHTRIAHRLDHHATLAPSRLHTLLHGATPRAIWLRGALTGAAFAAALILCALPLLQHRTPASPQIQTTASIAAPSLPSTPSAGNVNFAAQSRDASLAQTKSCANPAIVSLPQSKAPSSPLRQLRADTRLEAIAPSHPAPALPLTPQERQLARLVRVATPTELASLNPEVQAKRDAEESANFQKFFTPPPPPPPPDSNPDSQPTPPSAPLVNE